MYMPTIKPTFISVTMTQIEVNIDKSNIKFKKSLPNFRSLKSVTFKRHHPCFTTTYLAVKNQLHMLSTTPSIQKL